ncbi:MAG: hypothetical protein QOG20_1206 [Pseudonocardiales bacterium]|nr:hypothetical protein [Pseudonocardiales bacterium]
MTIHTEDGRERGRWSPRSAVAAWPVWQMPGRLLGSVVVVELTMVLLVTLGLIARPVLTDSELTYAVVLSVLGIVHTELARDVERVRWRITGNLHVDLTSVWIFAAVVVLPAGYAALVALLVHSYLWLRSARTRAPLHRQLFSTATITLSCLAASSVMTQVETVVGALPVRGVELIAIVVAILVFITVNSALVAGAIAVSTGGGTPGDLLGEWDENLLELAALSLGGLTGLVVLVNPWLVLLVLPPLLVLHRAVLVRHLQEAASIDGKTGLLNAAAWHTKAERALQRVVRGEGPRAVLVLDLDHFKVVNDTHGHLAGDQVLAAVADALRSEVRDRDLVGRFGGEEFVVLLAGLQGGCAADLEAVADRIRRRVAALRVELPTPDGPLTIAGLSVSVGVAVQPGAGGELRSLLQIADAALYAAKRAGRNAVRMGPAPADLPAPLDGEIPLPAVDAQ